eukprot:2524168-Heterocapsa_arctica.AAC.1
MLHRLMCYINSSLDLILKGHIGDKRKDFTLALYSDADFAGDKESSKSTSTPEAKIVAANAAVRTEGLPALQLWDIVLGRQVDL